MRMVVKRVTLQPHTSPKRHINYPATTAGATGNVPSAADGTHLQTNRLGKQATVTGADSIDNVAAGRTPHGSAAVGKQSAGSSKDGARNSDGCLDYLGSDDDENALVSKQIGGVIRDSALGRIYANKAGSRSLESQLRAIEANVQRMSENPTDPPARLCDYDGFEDDDDGTLSIDEVVVSMLRNGVLGKTYDSEEPSYYKLDRELAAIQAHIRRILGCRPTAELETVSAPVPGSTMRRRMSAPAPDSTMRRRMSAPGPDSSMTQSRSLGASAGAAMLVPTAEFTFDSIGKAGSRRGSPLPSGRDYNGSRRRSLP